jgi:hypothetical protein
MYDFPLLLEVASGNSEGVAEWLVGMLIYLSTDVRSVS